MGDDGLWRFLKQGDCWQLDPLGSQHQVLQPPDLFDDLNVHNGRPSIGLGAAILAVAVPRVRIVAICVGRLWQTVLFFTGGADRDAPAAMRAMGTHPIKRCAAEQFGPRIGPKMLFAIAVQINAGWLGFCRGTIPGIGISFVAVGCFGQSILVLASSADRDAPRL